jgi:hypothetical protein
MRIGYVFAMDAFLLPRACNVPSPGKVYAQGPLVIPNISIAQHLWLDSEQCDSFSWRRPRSAIRFPEAGVSYDEIQDVPHGDLRQHLYFSRTTGKWRRCFVYIPPNYDSDSSVTRCSICSIEQARMRPPRASKGGSISSWTTCPARPSYDIRILGVPNDVLHAVTADEHIFSPLRRVYLTPNLAGDVNHKLQLCPLFFFG